MSETLATRLDEATDALYGAFDSDQVEALRAYGEALHAALAATPTPPEIDVERLIAAENRWREYIAARPSETFTTRQLCEFIAAAYRAES